MNYVFMIIEATRNALIIILLCMIPFYIGLAGGTLHFCSHCYHFLSDG